MQPWPLLNIQDIVYECDRTLRALVTYVESLQQKSEGYSPPDATELLANVAALRELLPDLCPPALAQAIAAEQTVYDEEEARWEPTT